MYSLLTIAMDGPAGSGKSTVARQTAEKIGYLYLNSGSMYRAITLLAMRANVNSTRVHELVTLVKQCRLDFANNGRITLLNGEDVSDLIRTPEIDKAVMEVAKIPKLREETVKQQRRIGQHGGIVAEGRDVTTVVFPNADLKFYLDASVEERARRRFLELRAKEIDCTIERIEQDIRIRDEKDVSREHSPLRRADDAILIDTTDRTAQQVIEFITERIGCHS